MGTQQIHPVFIVTLCFIIYLRGETQNKKRRTHLEAQHGGATVKHLDAEGVDVGRADRRAALVELGVADDVKGETGVRLLKLGGVDVVAMVFGVEAPGDLFDGGRLMGRKKEDKMRQDENFRVRLFLSAKNRKSPGGAAPSRCSLWRDTPSYCR